MSLFAWKCKHIDLFFFQTRLLAKAKLPTFLTEGNLRNFILKLNLFSFVFFGFYHVFQTGRTAAKNNIQFQPYWSFFLIIGYAELKVYDKLMVIR